MIAASRPGLRYEHTSTASRVGSGQSAAAASRSSSSPRARRSGERGDQQPVAAFTLARIGCLLAGVALDRFGRELVDVREDGLGEERLGRAVDPRFPRDRGHPAPGDPRADAVRVLERVERAARAQLAPTDREVDLATRARPRRGPAHLIQELQQGLLDRGVDTAAELAAHRSPVGRNRGADGANDLLGDRGQLRLEQCSELARKRLPRALQLDFLFHGDNYDGFLRGSWQETCALSL